MNCSVKYIFRSRYELLFLTEDTILVTGENGPLYITTSTTLVKKPPRRPITSQQNGRFYSFFCCWILFKYTEISDSFYYPDVFKAGDEAVDNVELLG